jgi:hypothetical protein
VGKTEWTGACSPRRYDTISTTNYVSSVAVQHRVAHVLPRPHPAYALSSPSRASRSLHAPSILARIPQPLLPSSRIRIRASRSRAAAASQPLLPSARIPQPRIPSSRGSPSRSFRPPGSERDPWPRRRRAWPLGHNGGRDRPSLCGCGGSVRTAAGRRAGKRPRCAGARRSVAAAPFARLRDGARASVPGARARGARWRQLRSHGCGTARGQASPVRGRAALGGARAQARRPAPGLRYGRGLGMRQRSPIRTYGTSSEGSRPNPPMRRPNPPMRRQ